MTPSYLASLGTSALASNAGTTQAITVGTAVPATSMVVISAVGGATTPTLSSVADSRSNLYTKTTQLAAQSHYVVQFEAVVPSGKELQVNDTITLTWSATSAATQLAFADAFQSTVTSSPINKTSNNSAASNVNVTPASTHTVLGDLVVAVVGWPSASATFAPTASFVAGGAGKITSGSESAETYYALGVWGSDGANGTLSSQLAWIMQESTFFAIVPKAAPNVSQAVQAATVR